LSHAWHLLDVNLVIALTEKGHGGYRTAWNWFETPELMWGLCAFSEVGYLRITSNPRVGGYSIAEAEKVLAVLKKRPGYRYLPITADWAELVAPFRDRVWGHQQVTDAYLLGLAIKENCVLATMDRAIQHMAGPKYSKHVLVLNESTVRE
jgi:predicted nucleic acid-binding protein